MWAVDHVGDVAGLEEAVREPAGRDTGLAEHRFEGQRRMRTGARMLEQDRVAEHQVRGRDPGDLVERVVPRLHGAQRPERFGEQHGVAHPALERTRRREREAVSTVVIEDLRGQIRLSRASTIRLPISSVTSAASRTRCSASSSPARRTVAARSSIGRSRQALNAWWAVSRARSTAAASRLSNSRSTSPV
jgi:hypothetical protein